MTTTNNTIDWVIILIVKNAIVTFTLNDGKIIHEKLQFRNTAEILQSHKNKCYFSDFLN